MKRASIISMLRRFAAGLRPFTLLVPLAVVGCQGTEEPLGSSVAPLVASCVESGGSAPPGAWVCGDDALVECDSHQGAHVDVIYATLAAGGPLTCFDGTLTVSDPGPFLSGNHDLEVDVAAPGQPPSALCHSLLTVVDTLPPEVVIHEMRMWPPNHTLHHVSVADCVTVADACDPAPKAWFTGVSSDEADDAHGDCHTDGDIQNLSCDGVDLRAEREGGGDGRVYTLHVRVEDAAGQWVDSACRVVVPHDQGGGAIVDSGSAQHQDLPAGSCD